MQLLFKLFGLLEGAGAASLGGAVKQRHSLAGKGVGVVATGGNVDHDVFAQVLLEGAIDCGQFLG